MTVTNAMSTTLLYFLTAAFVQNLVLTTGIGSSIVMRIVRDPKNLGLFSLFLTGFCLLTVISFYPLDQWIGTDILAKLLRPVIIIAITSLWYLLAVTLFERAWPHFYEYTRTMLPLAAFNNVVVSVSLIANHQFRCSLLDCIGLALGACVGFVIIAFLAAEGADRLNDADTPKAFRGLPSMLVYLGLLALALCGFSSSVSFI